MAPYRWPILFGALFLASSAAVCAQTPFFGAGQGSIWYGESRSLQVQLTLVSAGAGEPVESNRFSLLLTENGETLEHLGGTWWGMQYRDRPGGILRLDEGSRYIGSPDGTNVYLTTDTAGFSMQRCVQLRLKVGDAVRLCQYEPGQ